MYYSQLIATLHNPMQSAALQEYSVVITVTFCLFICIHLHYIHQAAMYMYAVMLTKSLLLSYNLIPWLLSFFFACNMIY